MAMDLQKAAKSNNMLLKFLPKAASAFNFQNPPNLRAVRDKMRSDNNANKLKTNGGRGFSRPVISIIPADAPQKPENSSFQAQEPTSPKVSCMGQIQHKHKHKKKITSLQKMVMVSKYFNRKTSTTWNILSTTMKQLAGKKYDISADKPPLLDRSPTLSLMKRFATGRDTLTSFDWTALIAPVELDCRSYYSDEDRSGETKEEKEVDIPFSVPIPVGGGGRVAMEPRKEVNLWKRRTIVQPRPLQLNTLLLPNRS